MPTRRVVQIESSSVGENNAITQNSNNNKRKESSTTEKQISSAKKSKTKSLAKSSAPLKETPEARFVGLPIEKDEARRRWPERYDSEKKESEDNASDRKPKNAVENSEETGPAGFAKHYSKAEVDGATFELGDCVYVHSGNEQEYIGRIVEFFEDSKGEPWITAQWFFRIQDTAVKDVCESKHDKRRVYYSEVKDFNPLDCVVSKIKIVKLSPLHHFNVLNPKPIPSCDFYYDMGYDYAFSRFYSLPAELEATNSGSDVTFCNDVSNGQISVTTAECKSEIEVDSGRSRQVEYTLLDLYSGCGGMSTGLCLGASLSAVKLVTKWALDLNPNACKSLEFNHPETQVRNESAEDFLLLLKEWKKLCSQFAQSDNVKESKLRKRGQSSLASHDQEVDDSKPTKPGEYEVEKIIGIRHVSPPAVEKPGIEMKVRWKGYGANDDTWESLDGLSSCQDCVKIFVIEGKKKRILPLPGDVDVICGGPPCQGASGFNRFRNKEEPLADPRNKQIVVYMDIVNYLKPRFVLMENVVDILRFADGLLGRYALSRLVQMHYQAMLGMMVAGCYGLPQFRMRVMLWGAAPAERLPAYALPTHDVIQKGGIPVEWERNMVAYDENTKPKLSSPLTLGDALRDLPPVKNSEGRDEMSYGGGAQTEFQRFIRLPKEVLTGASSLSSCKKQKMLLHDHRPLELNKDDYQRVCRIPRKKGANFRNLPGVIVKDDNQVMLDPDMERVLLPSGKPLVPDYAITFVEGRSSKPFARLWWDETVPTVVTRAEPHNQAILHPEQDRVLTIRENARVQGFPDYYKLFGPVKQRYIQVGNAVAVPVGRALGYSLALAIKHVSTLNPTMVLPDKFPLCLMKEAQHISDIPLEEVENVDDAMPNKGPF